MTNPTQQDPNTNPQKQPNRFEPTANKAGQDEKEDNNNMGRNEQGYRKDQQQGQQGQQGRNNPSQQDDKSRMSGNKDQH